MACEERSLSLIPAIILAAAAKEPTTAVLIDPHGPTAAGVATALGVPTLDANLRVHRTLGGRWALTGQVDFTRFRAPLSVPTNHWGGRMGPRLGLRAKGLNDWMIHPFVLAGVSTLEGDGERLARYGVLGAGCEAGRTWVWGRFVFEVTTGLYSHVNVGYTARAEALEGEGPMAALPVKPMLNGRLGFAF
jgi:hypothetical protein